MANDKVVDIPTLQAQLKAANDLITTLYVRIEEMSIESVNTAAAMDKFSKLITGFVRSRADPKVVSVQDVINESSKIAIVLNNYAMYADGFRKRRANDVH